MRFSALLAFSMLPADTKIWTAHCCRMGERTSASWLTVKDLRELDTTLTTIGQAKHTAPVCSATLCGQSAADAGYRFSME